MTTLHPPGFDEASHNMAIDFDGVIHIWNKGWHDGTCYGDAVPGAIAALRILSQKYSLIVFTAKARADRPLVNGKTGTQLVWEWLKKNGVADCVTAVTAEKPRAMLYIDDNGYRFKSWEDTLYFIDGNT
jgi:hypothetical protein